ncbi:hypothetical protein [Pseudobacteriovorax antillogorgiicola]|uniref:Uncharacterized protein n=1 Tax=Pseudobacteriovorax antillogorgiicola TaxID=1513793 RepID=A0A1Y6CU37_9BACT|nr:hypothetical protein [Pseudobacteriovorax antillogorgiicola]TCS44375.1 hypothetical protein EDD56_1332 [Pseudobacteriovorax antillogorgiicola]SMF79439.1 hypothetical protein SAMN06296036_13372 [Pseudobacteriovorax antillogorgiicola]
MKSEKLDQKPLSGFTKFEAKFIKQTGRSRLKVMAISAIAALLGVAAMFLTLTELGQLNDNIAGVFESSDEVQMAAQADIDRGPVEAAMSEETAEQESPKIEDENQRPPLDGQR